MKNDLPENIKRILDKKHFTFDDFADIVRFLRSPDGCPWDRAQTHESIEINAIEEVYELVDAVKKNSAEKMTEEAGDVILQSVLHSVIAEEKGEFTLQDVIDGECVKLITRHTHIFGGDDARDEETALKYWEKNKYTEKKLESAGERVSDVPETLPALLRAEKVQKRASRFGLDFTDAEQIYIKLKEETEEFAFAAANKDEKAMKEEIGDLLFTAVNLARFYGVEAETALTASTKKFIERFLETERLIKADGKDFGDLTPEEADAYYDAAKKN